LNAGLLIESVASELIDEPSPGEGARPHRHTPPEVYDVERNLDGALAA
jgi:hypothetical protein